MLISGHHIGRPQCFDDLTAGHPDTNFSLNGADSDFRASLLSLAERSSLVTDRFATRQENGQQPESEMQALLKKRLM